MEEGDFAEVEGEVVKGAALPGVMSQIFRATCHD